MSQQYTWLHIGLGSFHRAHQAWYLNELIKAGNDSWAIAAGNIRNDSEHTVQALQAQNGEYVLETISPHDERAYEVIKSIKKLLPWQADLAPLIEEGAAEATKSDCLYRDRSRLLSRQCIPLGPKQPQPASRFAGRP